MTKASRLTTSRVRQKRRRAQPRLFVKRLGWTRISSSTFMTWLKSTKRGMDSSAKRCRHRFTKRSKTFPTCTTCLTEGQLQTISQQCRLEPRSKRAWMHARSSGLRWSRPVSWVIQHPTTGPISSIGRMLDTSKMAPLRHHQLTRVTISGWSTVTAALL